MADGILVWHVWFASIDLNRLTRRLGNTVPSTIPTGWDLARILSHSLEARLLVAVGTRKLKYLSCARQAENCKSENSDDDVELFSVGFGRHWELTRSSSPFYCSAMMSHLPHAVVAILVVFHRSILGWVFSLLLRLGLTAGLIGIKVKSLRSPTGLNKDGSQASRDRVEIRFHPIPLVLGRRVIFRNRGFCKLRQVMEEDGNSGSKGVDKGSRVKSVTYHGRVCRLPR